jgi:two-component system alkaline phosphatase synthesis response regulator PhoP
MTLNQLVQTWENELEKVSDSLLIENPIKYSKLKNYMIEIKKKIEEPEDFGIAINREGYEVIIDNKRHIFPKKIFKIINYFLENPNKCISRNELLKNCWEDGVIVGDRTIDVHVCKLKRLTKNKMNIITQKGYGYRYKV